MHSNYISFSCLASTETYNYKPIDALIKHSNRGLLKICHKQQFYIYPAYLLLAIIMLFTKFL